MRIFIIVISLFIGGFYLISQTETYKSFAFRSLDEVNPKFELVDMNNNPVSNKDLLGKNYIVGFGYTNCIDVCPVTLATLSGILDELEQRYGKEILNNYKSVFISIDPDRDSPEMLADFIKGTFHDDIIALTGTTKQIKDMGDAFKIEYYKYGNVEEKLYTMMHPTYLYIINSKGKYIAKIAHITRPKIAVDLMIKKLGK